MSDPIAHEIFMRCLSPVTEALSEMQRGLIGMMEQLDRLEEERRNGSGNNPQLKRDAEQLDKLL